MKLQLDGNVIFFDRKYLPIVSKYRWKIKKDERRKNATLYAYAVVIVNRKRYRLSMHRLLTGMKERDVDHKNGNGLDNRESNLRLCYHPRFNSYNKRSKNSFGYKGVAIGSQRHKRKRYCARIHKNGIRYDSKYFDSPKDAALEYDKMAKRLFKEFAALNFPRTTK